MCFSVLFTGLSWARDVKMGDRLCKFYTNNMKTCQGDCFSASVPAVKAKGIPDGAVSDDVAMNDRADFLLQVKCKDDPITTSWNKNQGKNCHS